MAQCLSFGTTMNTIFGFGKTSSSCFASAVSVFRFLLYFAALQTHEFLGLTYYLIDCPSFCPNFIMEIIRNFLHLSQNLRIWQRKCLLTCGFQHPLYFPVALPPHDTLSSLSSKTVLWHSKDHWRIDILLMFF